MLRKTLALALAVITLAACDQGSSPRHMTAEIEEPPIPDTTAIKERRENAPRLAYRHRLSLEMAADKVAPRFERARNACLEDAALACTLVRASIYVGDPNTGVPPDASLSVRLPHDQVAAYEKILLAPMEGEGEGEPVLRRRATEAEDLTYAIADLERRLAQAVDYRERLLALSKQSGAKVAELIQIEEKLSQVQSEIERMTGEQRGLTIRVDTELLDITLNAKPSFSVASSPLAEAWRDAGRVLGESAAAAFTFLVIALPWLPLAALAAYLVSRLWRVLRRRRAQAQAAEARTQPGTLTSPAGS